MTKFMHTSKDTYMRTYMYTYMYAVIQYVCLLLVLTSSGHSQSQESSEFCLTETFKGTCSGSDVILITSASYGRMRLGRCIRGDFNLGCSNDVTSHLDSLCSGRKSCMVPVRTLVDMKPCQRDFASYLEVSYSCINVLDLGMTSCPSRGHVTTDSASGYLSNSLYESYSDLGRADCPWIIRGKPGQKIQLSLILLESETSSSSSNQPACSQVIVINDDIDEEDEDEDEDDDDDEGGVELHVCEKRLRERVLFTSQRHIIKIYVKSSSNNPQSATVTQISADQEQSTSAHKKFLLHYRVVGCPLLTLSDSAWMKRIGPSGDDVMIRCNDTMETWYLSCQNDEWIGVMGNCSTATQDHSREVLTRPNFSFAKDGIAYALGLGLILGVIIAVVTLLSACCVKHTCGTSRHCKSWRAVLAPKPDGEVLQCPFQSIHCPHQGRDDCLIDGFKSDQGHVIDPNHHHVINTCHNVYVGSSTESSRGGNYHQLRCLQVPQEKSVYEGSVIQAPGCGNSAHTVKCYDNSCGGFVSNNLDNSYLTCYMKNQDLIPVCQHSEHYNTRPSPIGSRSSDEIRDVDDSHSVSNCLDRYMAGEMVERGNGHSRQIFEDTTLRNSCATSPDSEDLSRIEPLSCSARINYNDEYQFGLKSPDLGTILV